jgi:hypothetical protein
MTPQIDFSPYPPGRSSGSTGSKTERRTGAAAGCASARLSSFFFSGAAGDASRLIEPVA